MDVRFSVQDRKMVIAICGDLDNAAAPEAEKMMERVYTQDEYDILVDCSHLNYISSKGLRLLINLYKHCRNTGHRSYITNMNENVREVLFIGDFLKLYEEIK